MKNALWFLIGVISGFAAAHLVSKDPRGHELLADIDARIAEFTDRVTDAYRLAGGQVRRRARATCRMPPPTRSSRPRPPHPTPPTRRQALGRRRRRDAASQAAKKLTD